MEYALLQPITLNPIGVSDARQPYKECWGISAKASY